MNGEYRAGIIGLGRMGASIDDEMAGHPVFLVPYSHAAVFAHEPRIRLVAGAAPSEASRVRFQERYGDVRTYADYNEMLEEESLDIVGVATHAPLHADATVAAAAAGARGILVTKPMAISLAECDRMMEACRQHGTKLTIGHGRRWMEHYRLARKLIAEGAVGEVREATAYCTHGLVHNVTHLFDILLMLLDEPMEWMAGYLEGEFDPPETLTHRRDASGGGIGRTRSGVAVHFAGAHDKILGLDIDVVGTDGVLRCLYNGLGLELWENDPDDPYTQLRKAEIDPPQETASQTTGAIEDLIQAIETDGETCSTGEDGRAALEMCIAIHESQRLGNQRIDFPVQNRELSVWCR